MARWRKWLPAARFWQWHGLTWIVLVLVLTCLFFGNVPGEHGTPIWNYNRISHGWPLIYLEREVDSQSFSNWQPDIFWGVSGDLAVFRLWALFADLAIGMLIVAVVVGLSEHWARHQRGLYAVELRRWRWSAFFATLAAAAAMALWWHEQSRLSDVNAGRTNGEYGTYWELPFSKAVTQVSASAQYLGLVLLAAALLFGVRRCLDPAAARSTASLSKRLPAWLAGSTLVCGAVLAWTLYRLRMPFVTPAAMLFDAATLVVVLPCAALIVRWAWQRLKQLRGLTWQYGMRSLLAAATVIPLAAYYVGDRMRVVAMQRAADVDRVIPWLMIPDGLVDLVLSNSQAFDWLRSWDEELATIGLVYPLYQEFSPSDDEDAMRANRLLIDRFPLATAVSIGDWDDIPPARIRELSHARALVVDDSRPAVLREIKRFEQLRWLFYMSDQGSSSPKPDMLALLPPSYEMRKLYLYGVDASDDRLAVLAGMPLLEELHLTATPAGYNEFESQSLPLPEYVFARWRNATASRTSTPITDEGLRSLGGLKRLRRLRLEGTAITGRGLAYLRGLDQLYDLTIDNALIDDAGLAHLHGCDAIARLNLTNNDVNTLGQLDLGRFPRLREVNLSGTPLDAARLHELRLQHPHIQFKHLLLDEIEAVRRGSTEYLTCYVRVFEPQLTGLLTLENLRCLGFAQSNITDAGLAQIAPVEELQTLVLSRTVIGDEGLAHLSGFRELNELRLDDTNVTSRGLALLRGMDKLKHLHLSDTAIDDAGLAHLSGLVDLESLQLHNTDVTSAGLAHLERLTSLKVLSLDYEMINDEAVEHLRQLCSLETLSISHASDYNVAEALAARLRKQLLGLAIHGVSWTDP